MWRCEYARKQLWTAPPFHLFLCVSPQPPAPQPVPRVPSAMPIRMLTNRRYSGGWQTPHLGEMEYRLSTAEEAALRTARERVPWLHSQFVSPTVQLLP